MKVLLVSIDAKYIHTNNAVRLLQANSSFLVDVLEFTIKDDVKAIQEEILNHAPDVLGLSVYIWNVNLVMTLLESLDVPDTTIVLGGPEVSYDPEPFLHLKGVKYVVRGEGEVVFEQLLQHMQANTSPTNLSNLAWQDEGVVRMNPIEEIEDLSIIKPPYYRDQDRPHLPHRISYIESSRGCPYHCSYCLSSLEKTVRFFPVEDVLRAIDYLMDNGVKTVKFLDRTFNANKNTLRILDHIIQRDNNLTVFQFEITGDVLSKDIIDYIHNHARPGLFRFEIGIQSTNETTNHLVDRHQNTPKLFDRIRLIQSKQIIDLHLDLIAGLPEENLSSFIETFDEVYRLGAKELQLGFLKMLRGTKIRYQADRFGYVYDANAPYEIRSNNVLSIQDISQIKLVEHMLELYHNKGYFGSHLSEIIQQSSSPYQFLLTIGEHYKRHNYKMTGYQMKDIYEHLLELLDDRETYLVLQDYLLRSNIKPEQFYPNKMDKATRNKILTALSERYQIPLHKLYKHSRLLQYESDIFCAYYEHNQCHSYQTKAPI